MAREPTPHRPGHPQPTPEHQRSRRPGGRRLPARPPDRRDLSGHLCGVVLVSAVLYKGLAAAGPARRAYLDLVTTRFEGQFAIFHQRYSTNTLPTWERAQPYRMLCHNARSTPSEATKTACAPARAAPVAAGLGPEEMFRPLLDPDTSDSGKLDEAVALLTRGGRDVRHAMAMLIPERGSTPTTSTRRTRVLPPTPPHGAVGRPAGRVHRTVGALARCSTATGSRPALGLRGRLVMSASRWVPSTSWVTARWSAAASDQGR